MNRADKKKIWNVAKGFTIIFGVTMISLYLSSKFIEKSEMALAKMSWTHFIFFSILVSGILMGALYHYKLIK